MLKLIGAGVPQVGMAENDPEPTTISSQVDPDLAEQVEQLANAEGKSKSQWIREAVGEVASEDSAEMDAQDEIRADVNRVEDKVENAVQLMVRELRRQRRQQEQTATKETERAGDDSSGVEGFAPGGERDPGPLGALNRLMDGD